MGPGESRLIRSATTSMTGKRKSSPRSAPVKSMHLLMAYGSVSIVSRAGSKEITEGSPISSWVISAGSSESEDTEVVDEGDKEFIGAGSPWVAAIPLGTDSQREECSGHGVRHVD